MSIFENKFGTNFDIFTGRKELDESSTGLKEFVDGVRTEKLF